MPKYWVKNYFAHGRFPEVGKKQKTEEKKEKKRERDWTMVITMAKLRMAHASTHGARKPPGPISREILQTKTTYCTGKWYYLPFLTENNIIWFILLFGQIIFFWGGWKSCWEKDREKKKYVLKLQGLELVQAAVTKWWPNNFFTYSFYLDENRVAYWKSASWEWKAMHGERRREILQLQDTLVG